MDVLLNRILLLTSFVGGAFLPHYLAFLLLVEIALVLVWARK